MLRISKMISSSKDVHLNILSLTNVCLGFAFIVILGRKLGLGSGTDVYFYALVIATYLEKFISVSWVAIKHYYVELKLNKNESLNNIYIILLNNIIILSILIILSYYLVTGYFSIFTKEVKAFLDIFIFYILIHSMLTYNKKILNLEHRYASVYLVDTFIHVINLVVAILFVKHDATYIAFSTLFASSLVVIWQLKKVFSLNNFKYKLIFYDKFLVKELFKNSFKLEISSILYSSKDVLIASVLTGFGSGIFSLYSYANKFIGVISQVVTAPVENVYSARISKIIAIKDFKSSLVYTKRILLQNSLLFLVSIIFTFLVMPYILDIMLGSKISSSEINIILKLFLFLGTYNFLKVCELPYKKVLNLFKFFNFGILINLVYFIIAIVGYILILKMNLDYIYILVCVILGQITKLILTKIKYNSALSNKLNIVEA